MSDILPVGTLSAWLGLDRQRIPPNWLECSTGSALDKRDYLDLFYAIGYSNGGSGSVFKIPEMQGRFLRGANQNEFVAGSSAEAKTARPDVWLDIKTPSGDVETTKGSINTGQLWNNDSFGGDFGGGDDETRPVNSYVWWIIKAYQSTDIEDGVDVPTGLVFPWAGATGTSTLNPSYPYFINCNGNYIQDGKNLPVAKQVGNLFDDGNAPAGNWVAPNYIGMFLRGVDLSGVHDPNSGDRQPPPSGSKAYVGSWQKTGTQFRGSPPRVSIPHITRNTAKVDKSAVKPANIIGVGGNRQYSEKDFSGGAKESRPENVAAEYFISSGSSKTPEFPIGGIIAIPGESLPDENVWRKCDGSIIKKPSDALRRAIKDLWGRSGSDESPDSVLPNIGGRFIRGSNPNGMVKDIDPDWDKRTNSATDSATIGSGSLQNAVAGMPTNPIKFGPIDVYDDHFAVQQWGGSPSSGMAGNPSGMSRLQVDNQNYDPVTAPVCWNAWYYIKIA